MSAVMLVSYCRCYSLTLTQPDALIWLTRPTREYMAGFRTKDLSVYVRSLAYMLAPELKLQLSCTNLQTTELKATELERVHATSRFLCRCS